MTKEFTPINASGVSISATSTSASGVLIATGDKILVSNKGDKWASYRIGSCAQTAVVADTLIAPGTQHLIGKSLSGATFSNATHAAVVTTGADTTTVVFSSVY